MARFLAPDVKQRFREWVYPAPLLCIILFEWLSNGLSLVFQSIFQQDDRMASAAWYYHRKLNFLPGGASLWWGLIWIVSGLFILLALTQSLTVLIWTTCLAGIAPGVTAILFFLSAIRNNTVSFTGSTHYVAFLMLALVTGIFMKASIYIEVKNAE